MAKGFFAKSYKWLKELEKREFQRRLLRRIGYKVTYKDKRPFGEVTMRLWEPRNFIGRVYSWFMMRIYG